MLVVSYDLTKLAEDPCFEGYAQLYAKTLPILLHANMWTIFQQLVIPQCDIQVEERISFKP